MVKKNRRVEKKKLLKSDIYHQDKISIMCKLKKLDFGQK